MVHSKASAGALTQPLAGRIGVLTISIGVSDKFMMPSDSSMVTRWFFLTTKRLAIMFKSPSFSSSAVSMPVIKQGTRLSLAALLRKETSCTLTLPKTNISPSTCAVPTLIPPGCVPSITYKFSLWLLGGQEEPGQCQTKVLMPASAVTFHNCSA